MTHYRLFIAVELPPDVRQSLGRVQEKMKSVRAIRGTKPQQIHLTLQFLGDTPTAKVDAIAEALQHTVSPLSPFSVTLNGIGAFPNLKRPRVIWTGVSGQVDELKTLHRAVLDATKTVGFEPESRPFKPHLTFGRVQKWAKFNDYTNIRQVVERSQIGEIAAFQVAHIGLIRSQLKPSGPIYTELARIDLTRTSRN